MPGQDKEGQLIEGQVRTGQGRSVI